MQYIDHYESPLGKMTMAGDGERLTGLWFDGQKYFGSTLGKLVREQKLPVFVQTKQWLDLYFAGERPDFVPPLQLDTAGTAFRREVWKILLEIPYGETMTYREIAGRIAAGRGIKTMSAQAVGGAVGHNPVSLIVPCHRVVGSDGSLTGYAGGLDRKKKLLEMEQRQIRSK